MSTPGEMFRIVGAETGCNYAMPFIPSATEVEMARHLNAYFDLVMERAWGDPGEGLAVQLYNPDFTDPAEKWKP